VSFPADENRRRTKRGTTLAWRLDSLRIGLGLDNPRGRLVFASQMKDRKYWLLKTEPGVFSFEDLLNAPKRTTHWEGVRNYQARNLLRDEIQKGDRAFIYHSNAEPPAVMGIAEVVRAGYPDLLALDPKSPYFDPKAKAKGESPWTMIDVRATHRMRIPVALSEMKGKAALRDMVLLKKGSRLSVQPVTEAEFDFVCTLGKPEAI
jgi:predicted RNA-binding protein with PUA-like domain